MGNSDNPSKGTLTRLVPTPGNGVQAQPIVVDKTSALEALKNERTRLMGEHAQIQESILRYKDSFATNYINLFTNLAMQLVVKGESVTRALEIAVLFTDEMMEKEPTLRASFQGRVKLPDVYDKANMQVGSQITEISFAITKAEKQFEDSQR